MFIFQRVIVNPVLLGCSTQFRVPEKKVITQKEKTGIEFRQRRSLFRTIWTNLNDAHSSKKGRNRESDQEKQWTFQAEPFHMWENFKGRRNLRYPRGSYKWRKSLE